MPKERFTPQVANVLRAAGWYEGRDLGAEAERMLESTIESARAEGRALEAFPAIRAAMHEFGGLSFTKEALGGSFHGRDMQIDSSLLVHGFGKFEHVGHVVGNRCFPLGYEPGERATLLMAENGEVYVLHYARDAYAGTSMAAALNALLDLKGALPDLWDYYEMDVVEESGYRFNERTTGILLGAGWTLGRDFGAHAAEMIARAVAEAAAQRIEIEAFPAAVAAIREFGGLSFTKEALEDSAGFDTADFRVDPVVGLTQPSAARLLERAVGKRCFPFGRAPESDSVLWIDVDGGLYEVYDDAIERFGETTDESMSHRLQGYPPEEIPSDEVEG